MSFDKRKENRCWLCTNGLCVEVTNTENTSCKACGATWRAQAMMRGILRGLAYGPSIGVNKISTDLSRTGLGIGDDWKLARTLSQKFSYVNSFLHKFPILDLLDPPDSCIANFEFISCSDVLEHTPPPRVRPFNGLFEMLKPGGFAMISVPITRGIEYREFYPNLVSWKLTDGAVHWIDVDGRSFIDENPEFHDGEGLTLTFRQWSMKQLEDDLNLAGFSQIEFQPNLEFKHSNIDIALVIARR